MWCSSASLSVWANAWLAGSAAPDDVLDALSSWAPKQFVTADDSVAAGHTGMSWPEADDGGPIALLQTLRTAARSPDLPPIDVVLPVPGDVRGLAAGTQFERDALAAEEAILLTGDKGSTIGLVPEYDYDDAGFVTALAWTVYSLPTTPAPDSPDLAAAEYALRSAVRCAADALVAIGAGSGGPDVAHPRDMVEQVLESTRHHRVPDDAPPRALRVLENAAHVDAILTVSSGVTPSDALRPLPAVVRTARVAAIGAILRSAWRR